MSEFTNTRADWANVRHRLLTTVSAAALLASVYSTHEARAADGDRPPLWIELEGQFAQQENGEEAFLPPFLLGSPFPAASQIDIEKSSPKIWNRGAKITFQPTGSDWVLSLGIRYAKTARDENPNHVASSPDAQGKYDSYQNFRARSTQTHLIADFQAGKDVGLGKFGSNGSSVVGLGVRIAQFSSRSSVAIASQPTNTAGYSTYHRFYAAFAAKRKFSGIGPSLSWDASANLTGNSSAGSISFDWGMNGAVLFGRQRAQTQHQTTDNLHPHKIYIPTHYFPTNNFGTNGIRYGHVPVYQHAASPAARSKSVSVPNLGGFAGVSWRYGDAKISFGYRADMFFGAVDGGIDTRKSEDRGFYGPFASFSVGVGD